jgi:hypothetical protein
VTSVRTVQCADIGIPSTVMVAICIRSMTGDPLTDRRSLVCPWLNAA